MANMTEQSVGPLALDAIWLDEATQASSSGYGVADLFSWDEEVGADFAAEVESVSRLFPHLDGLPSELSGDGAPAVARQAAVCGGTRVALGADPGSPADALASPGDQCLMSPSDALLASPDPSLAASPLAPSPYGADISSAGDWKVATSRRARSESVHIPAENTVTDDITTLIEFVEPARAASKRPPSEEEIFVSPADLEMPTTSKHTDTTSAAPLPDESSCTSAAGSPEQEAQEEEDALSPEVAEFLLSAAHAQQEDEHTRMIDQALLDLKTLETLCGISSDSQQPAAGVDSAAIAADLLSAVTEPAAAPTARPAVAASAVKQEPAPQADQEEEDIEIVEERPAPRRRRRRPPRVAVTPPAAVAAAPATQIVIVLTSEQLANIQQSGQLVLSAAALQPGLATAQPRGREQTSTRTATVLKRAGAATATSTSGVTKTTSTNTKTAGTSTSVTNTTGTSAASTSSIGAVKRPRVIVKQETPAKRARTAQSTATGTEDPLSGWMEQKFPPSAAGWDVPLLPAGVGEVPLAGDEEEAASGCIPEDLQDVLLDGTDAGAVPSLPAEAADCLLEELISGSVRENPGLFDGAPPHDVLVKPQPQQPLQQQPQPLLGELQPPTQQLQAPASPPLQLLAPGPVAFTLSPQPQQQLTLEPWAAALCHSPGEQPSSPSSECCSPELAPAPDWQPGPAARRGARRPRPYDKTPGSAGRGAGAARRQPLTEEERRERKKEQNKNAATRYRQKKKEEHDLVSGDQEMLEARNKVLRDRVGALSRELNYLKQLMREVLRHKQVTA